MQMSKEQRKKIVLTFQQVQTSLVWYFKKLFLKFSAYIWVSIVLYLDGKKGNFFSQEFVVVFLRELFVCHEAEESTQTCRQTNFGAVNIKTDPVLMKTALIWVVVGRVSFRQLQHNK